MPWEWVYRSQERQWSLTIGEWQAIVRRVEGLCYLWRAAIERTSAPHDRYDGPITPDALEAWTWLLDEDCRATGTPRSRHLTRRWRGDHAVAQLIGSPHSSIAAPRSSKASPPFRLIADRRDPTPSLSILDSC
jgi:hypothetical protein